MWVMNVPVLSTAHLTFKTANIEITLDFEGPGGLYAVSTPGGFMVHSDDDVSEDPEIPDDLKRVLAWANEAGYEWVRFDPDGSIVGELTTYEW